MHLRIASILFSIAGIWGVLACGPGAINEDSMVGDWNAEGGGSVTFEDDGSATTDAGFFLDQLCGGIDNLSEITLLWGVDSDPDVVNDNLGFALTDETHAATMAEGCTVAGGAEDGEWDWTEPVLSINANRIQFGINLLGEEIIAETLNRQ